MQKEEKKHANIMIRQYIKKQRNNFADKIYILKVIVFPVVMYRYESWSIKMAEH